MAGRARRTTPAETTTRAKRTPKPKLSPQEAAERAYLAAYLAHDKAQDDFIAAQKAVTVAEKHMGYTKRVMDHAGYHPDLPEDFDHEAYVAEQTKGKSEVKQADADVDAVAAEAEAIPPQPTEVEKQEGAIPVGATEVVNATSEPEPVVAPEQTSPGQQAAPPDDDDPFAGIG